MIQSVVLIYARDALVLCRVLPPVPAAGRAIKLRPKCAAMQSNVLRRIFASDVANLVWFRIFNSHMCMIVRLRLLLLRFYGEQLRRPCREALGDASAPMTNSTRAATIKCAFNANAAHAMRCSWSVWHRVCLRIKCTRTPLT